VVRNISAGTIVWVRLGPRGGYKERPAVVLDSPDSDGNLFVVVGTTQVGDDPATEIELPSSAPIRHPLTKLKKRTVVCLTWREKIHRSSIRDIGGDCPRSLLLDIKRKIRAIAQKHRET
jgi:mRNA-degrading endonuclease toxin of MazEF toxin-antitoxin module